MVSTFRCAVDGEDGLLLADISSTNGCPLVIHWTDASRTFEHECNVVIRHSLMTATEIYSLDTPEEMRTLKGAFDEDTASTVKLISAALKGDTECNGHAITLALKFASDKEINVPFFLACTFALY